MRSKLVFLGILVLVSLSLTALGLAQTQITIGNSTSGTVTFAGQGTTTVSFVGSCASSSRNCVSGYAYLGSNAGTYNMWITGSNPTLSATGSPDVFAVNMNGGTLHFSFSLGSSTFAGTITLTTLKDGTLAPQFLGSLSVTSATGLFAGIYAPGQTIPFDMTISLPKGPTVGQVNAAGGSTSGSVSSGEIIPAPEPGTIALLGSGLLAVGGFLKRRLR